MHCSRNGVHVRWNVNTALDPATNVIYDKGLKSIEYSYPFSISLSLVLSWSIVISISSSSSLQDDCELAFQGWIVLKKQNLEKPKTPGSPTYRVFRFSFRCAAVTVIHDNSQADSWSCISLCTRHYLSSSLVLEIFIFLGTTFTNS